MFHLLERYTVESVTCGHPDKVCDQMSDAILDAMLEQDPFSRAGVETFGSHGTLMIGGEVKTKAKIDFTKKSATGTILKFLCVSRSNRPTSRWELITAARETKASCMDTRQMKPKK